MSEENKSKSKVEVEGIEPVTSGCPSLGLPRIPSGADGVERGEDVHRQPQPSTSTLSRTDYEQIISDVFHKCNDAFINAPHQREARPVYFKVVVGDLADALASVVPCERSARGADPTESNRTTVCGDVLCDKMYKTPDSVIDVVIDNLTPDQLKRICVRHGLKKRMTPAEYTTVAEGCKLTQFKGTNATRLVAVRKGREGAADFLYEISVDHENATAVIERDGEMLYQIKTLGLSYKRVIHAAIQVLRSHLAENNGVNRRHRLSRQRRAEKRIEQEINRELDATIARQMGYDDLAEQIENA